MGYEIEKPVGTLTQLMQTLKINKYPWEAPKYMYTNLTELPW